MKWVKVIDELPEWEVQTIFACKGENKHVYYEIGYLKYIDKKGPVFIGPDDEYQNVLAWTYIEPYEVD